LDEAATLPPVAKEPVVEPETVQEYETKERIRSTIHSINVETSSHAIPVSVKTQLYEIEQKLYLEDNRFLSWKKCRNDLEAYSYDMRNQLDEYGSFVKYCEPSVKT